MEQLELFPNDFVRFATEFPREKLNILREDNPYEYYRIRQIRDAICEHEFAVKALDKRLAWKLDGLKSNQPSTRRAS